MAKNSSVSRRFKRRKNRSKKTSKFHLTLPRLVVYRSLNHFIAQVINDFDGKTIVATSSHDKELRANGLMGNVKLNPYSDYVGMKFKIILILVTFCLKFMVLFGISFFQALLKKDSKGTRGIMF